MTSDERAMLNDLAGKIAQTPAPTHDAEAEEFIRTNIGSRPDALYLLTQTVLIQNLAIQHAHQEIQDLKQRTAQGAAPAAGSSFLGATAAQAGPPPLPQSGPQYAPQPAPQYVPQYATPSSGGGFLRSAAQTAAGVAAGALAFEGIRSLFGGAFGGWGGPNLGSFGGGGFGGGSFLGESRTEETVINNYYDSPGGRQDRDSNDHGQTTNAEADDSTVADNYDDSGSSVEDTSYSDDGGSSGGDDSV